MGAKNEAWGRGRGLSMAMGEKKMCGLIMEDNGCSGVTKVNGFKGSGRQLWEAIVGE